MGAKGSKCFSKCADMPSAPEGGQNRSASPLTTSSPRTTPPVAAHPNELAEEAAEVPHGFQAAAEAACPISVVAEETPSAVAKEEAPPAVATEEAPVAEEVPPTVAPVAEETGVGEEESVAEDTATTAAVASTNAAEAQVQIVELHQKEPQKLQLLSVKPYQLIIRKFGSPFGCRHFVVQADELWTVHDLKLKIEEQASVPSCTQSVMHNNKVLKDEQTLRDCDIQNESTIVMMVTSQLTWEWEVAKGVWAAYPQEVVRKINRARRAQKALGVTEPIRFQTDTIGGTFNYDLWLTPDGEGMKQQNVDTKTWRRVRSRVLQPVKWGTESEAPAPGVQMRRLRPEQYPIGSDDCKELRAVNEAIALFVASGQRADKVVQVDVYESVHVDQAYEAKRRELQKLAGGNPCREEVWGLHGSPDADVVEEIMHSGFKVGGVDAGVKVRHGSVYGKGVYVSINARDPMLYAGGTNRIILSQGLRGCINGEDDCYKPPDRPQWRVFKAGQQLRPRYVLHYSES